MKRLALVLVIAAGALGCGASDGRHAPIIDLRDVRYRAGDDSPWAAPDFPDSSWTATKFWSVHGTDGLYWMRAQFDIEPRHITPGRPMAIQFVGMATAEIYWDGVRLPTPGVVGATPAEEVPGPIQATTHVPDTLAVPGSHVVALRLSSHHRGFEPVGALWLLLVGDYGTLMTYQVAYTTTALLSLSGLVIVGLFFLALFALNRHERSPLWLGLLCMASACLLVAESWRPLFGYTYDWHIVRLRVIAALTYLVNLLLLHSVVAMFPQRAGRIALAAATLLLTLPMFLSAAWDLKQIGMFGIGLGAALLWCGYAAVRRQPGALLAALALAGTIVIGLSQPGRFADQTFFIMADVLLIALLVAHAVRTRRAQQEREQALIRAARLEAELLRRHIQPHFLMNTLTALSQWMEEDPRVASRLIQALADEFRALSAIADQPLVSVADEVRLCESHVAVMGLRKGCEIRLQTEGLDPEAKIPPAVFHTLVENAITHAPNVSRVEMLLTRDIAGTRVRYRLVAPVGAEAEPGQEGTGLRYVRSRLREAFGSDWTLTRTVVAGAYRTEILLPAESH